MLSRLDPRLRAFLLRLPLGAAAALALWFAGLSVPWGASVTWAANASIRAFERQGATQLGYENGLAVVNRSDFSSRSDVPAFSLSGITSNLVLLVALVLSTPAALRFPGPWRVVAALLGLFVSHVTHLVLAVQTIYATQFGAWSEYAYPRWQRETVATGRYFFDIVLKFALPFVLFALTVAFSSEGDPPGEPSGVARAKSPKRRPEKRKGRG